MSQETSIINEKSDDNKQGTTIEKEDPLKYSDDLFPNFKTLSITTSNPQHELLHHLNAYQSLQVQLETQLRSTFMQLTKFKLQSNTQIIPDETEHQANKVVSTINTQSSTRYELDKTDSEFKPLSQAMVFPSLQLRQSVGSFEESLKTIISIINERQVLLDVLSKLEKIKKQERKR